MAFEHVSMCRVQAAVNTLVDWLAHVHAERALVNGLAGRSPT
jgi:hypothetical protein